MPIPAHRSMAAQIIACSPYRRGTADIFRIIFFLGSTAPFGDSPLHTISHIFMGGDERYPVMRVSFFQTPKSTLPSTVETA
jgi:hypothetical protein